MSTNSGLKDANTTSSSSLQERHRILSPWVPPLSTPKKHALHSITGLLLRKTLTKGQQICHLRRDLLLCGQVNWGRSQFTRQKTTSYHSQDRVLGSHGMSLQSIKEKARGNPIRKAMYSGRNIQARRTCKVTLTASRQGS